MIKSVMEKTGKLRYDRKKWKRGNVQTVNQAKLSAINPKIIDTICGVGYRLNL